MSSMESVCDLLEYIGLSENDLEHVYYKIHFWSFVESLADQLEESGSLSNKQQSSIVALILKHTGAVCDTSVLTHGTQYKRKGKKSKTSHNRVQHQFGTLLDIQLFDLPYESGSTQVLTFYPYSKSTTVTRIRSRYYRLPLPSKWGELKEPTEIHFLYKRTACKGYMELIGKQV